MLLIVANENSCRCLRVVDVFNFLLAKRFLLILETRVYIVCRPWPSLDTNVQRTGRFIQFG